MKKIMIIGSPGTGKSTLGKQLKNILAIDLYHLDQLLWKPNWEMSSIEEQQNIQLSLVEKESWIIDGNYARTLDIRLNQADTIIYLKRSRFVCFFHVFKRILTYHGRTRPDMQEDCPEKIDVSFFKWIWEFPNKQTPIIEEKLQQLKQQQTLILLTNQKEIDAFFEQINQYNP